MSRACLGHFLTPYQGFHSKSWPEWDPVRHLPATEGVEAGRESDSQLSQEGQAEEVSVAGRILIEKRGEVGG